jgi:hypothetical protein
MMVRAMRRLGVAAAGLAVLFASMGCNEKRLPENPKTAGTFKPQSRGELGGGLGKKTTVNGRARDIEGRAAVELNGGGNVFMADFASWPDRMAGQYVTVIGTLRRQDEDPCDFYLEDAEILSSGFGPGGKKTR